MLELDGTILVAMISFIIFAFIMNAILYQPVIKIIEDRKVFLQENETMAKNAEREEQNLTERKSDELAKARSLATEYVATGSEEFRQNFEKEIKAYTKEQREYSETEKRKLADEADKAGDILSVEAGSIAKLISEKVLGGKNA